MKKYYENGILMLENFKEECLYQDLARWSIRLKLQQGNVEDNFLKIYSSRPEYRAVFAYRLRMLKKPLMINKYNSINKGEAHVNNLYLTCKDIGPGLYLEHAFSSIILAKSIGSNFHLNQSVTIGAGSGGVPTIGDNVKVHTHSVIIGGINIGNNVTVAAGSIVVNDVPDNCTVASPKATIIRSN
ncbi:serine acetyltransferase [Cobetia crustatorum]|uniref:Serine acetyltransferase n=1 Tax=Cobetia crustatorum TaxID=553385 RepID=A0A558HQ76_9GAMM|nr:serine acetyltransferase [Cobetia crustatorum]TVU71284.1 serine acetyltransferase [Cobetia crustatorum]